MVNESQGSRRNRSGGPNLWSCRGAGDHRLGSQSQIQGTVPKSLQDRLARLEQRLGELERHLGLERPGDGAVDIAIDDESL